LEAERQETTNEEIALSAQLSMTRFFQLLLIATISACGAKEANDPVAREQALAKNDVWHAAKLRGVAFRAVG